MPIATVNGLELYYEEAGTGFPLVWNHEFAGDCRSLDLQAPALRQALSRHHLQLPWLAPIGGAGECRRLQHRCARRRSRRSSTAPGDPRAHIAGLSMGGNIALTFAARFPSAVASLIVVGCGSGTVNHQVFVAESERLAHIFETQGAGVAGEEIAQRTARRVYAEKDPRGYAEFVERLHAHSAHGAAAAIRGILVRRKTIFEMQDDLKEIVAPTLIIVGDQDDGAVEPSVFLRRSLAHASLLVLPFTGHIPNLEEPGLFNLHVGEFLAAVAEGRWAHWRGDSTHSGRLE